MELAATAVVGGFDIALGVAAYGLAATLVGGDTGTVVGAVAFGIGFVFVVLGRSELFTENFLVPIAGLNQRERGAWLKLGELWVVSLILNLAGGALLAVVLTSEDVLREGTAETLVDLADHLAEYSALTAFLSAIVAGALMTLMTWFVEGAATSSGIRIAAAWVVGFLLALGAFNHAVVSSIELIFGMRYGADVDVRQFMANLSLAVSGNLVGGLGLVTFARAAQAFGGGLREE